MLLKIKYSLDLIHNNSNCFDKFMMEIRCEKYESTKIKFVKLVAPQSLAFI